MGRARGAQKGKGNTMRTCKSCPHAIPDADMGAYECGVDHGLRYGYQGCDEDPPEDIDVDTLIVFSLARDYVINSTRNVPLEDVNAAAIRVMLDWREGIALAKEHGLELQRFAKAKADYHEHADRIKGYFFRAGLREDER